MACILHVFLIIALKTTAAIGIPTADTCPSDGCDESYSASASVLMQQIQHSGQDQQGKGFAKKVSSTASLSEDEQLDSSISQPAAPRASSAKRKDSSSLLARAFRTLSKRTSAATALPSENSMPLSMLQVSTKMLGMTRLAAKAAPRVHTLLRGWTAPLDEAGYQAVASLKSDDDMEMFVRRVIDAYDCKIVNQGVFMSMVPWFSGTTAIESFQRLQETLLYAVLTPTGKPWLQYKNTDGTTGANAELSFMGYVEVAATRTESEMAKFVNRVCKKLRVKITDEKALSAIVKRYSGEGQFQDYNQLEKDIMKLAGAHDSKVQDP